MSGFRARLLRACATLLLAVALWPGQRAQAQDAPPKDPALVVRRVGESWVTLSFRIEGFRTNPEMERDYVRKYGERGLVFGSAGDGSVNVSVILEKDAPHASDETWRTRFTRGQGKPFDADGTACVDVSAMIEGFRNTNFHAFPVAAGWCVDLHVSHLGPAEPPPLTRASFDAMARSFRVGFFRRGGFDEYAQPVLDAMHAAALRYHEIGVWAAEETKARPDDWVVPFVQGEAMKTAKAPDADCAAAYQRAVDLLAKRKDLGPKDRFAWAVAEEGLGLSLAGTKLPEATAHFRKGAEIAEALKHPLRAALNYDLACACARSGDAAGAVKALKSAIAVDPKFRDKATKDADFDAIRASKPFQDAVAPAAKAPPGK